MQPSPQMLPLKVRPWKPLGSWGLLSTSLLFIILAWSEQLVAQSCPTRCDPVDCSPTGFSVHGILCPWNSLGNTGVGCHASLQGIFPPQGLNQGLLQCRQILYHLSSKGSLILASVQFSHSVVSDSLRLHGLQYARPPCPSPTPGVYSNSCPLSQWCHPTISASVIPFSSCLQSLPASGSFQMSQFFISGGQSIGVSASASALPRNIQDWYTLGWTDWISLQSKGLSRVFFSNTTVQKHQFYCTMLSLQSNSHIHTWLLEKP